MKLPGLPAVRPGLVGDVNDFGQQFPLGRTRSLRIIGNSPKERLDLLPGRSVLPSDLLDLEQELIQGNLGDLAHQVTLARKMIEESLLGHVRDPTDFLHGRGFGPVALEERSGGLSNSRTHLELAALPAPQIQTLGSREIFHCGHFYHDPTWRCKITF